MWKTIHKALKFVLDEGDNSKVLFLLKIVYEDKGEKLLTPVEQTYNASGTDCY